MPDLLLRVNLTLVTFQEDRSRRHRFVDEDTDA